MRADAERLRAATLGVLRHAYFGNEYVIEWLGALMLGGAHAARLDEIERSTESSVCAKQFTAGEAAYQCRTCGVDPTCIQCTACFKLANHKGHDIKVRCQSERHRECDFCYSQFVASCFPCFFCVRICR